MAGIVLGVFLDPSRLEFVWSADRYTRRFDGKLQEEYWVKDLKKVKRAGYAFQRVLVVDDTSQKLERTYGNLVPVRPFLGDPADAELKTLPEFWEHVHDRQDFRTVEKRCWWLRRWQK